jgi:hypothetical protein
MWVGMGCRQLLDFRLESRTGQASTKKLHPANACCNTQKALGLQSTGQIPVASATPMGKGSF